MRIGEFTKTSTSTQHFLLYQHICLVYDKTHQVSSLEIIIPHYKHSTGPSRTLVIQPNKDDTTLCPIIALHNFLKVRKHGSPSDPLFSYMDNVPVSRQSFTQELNRTLKYCGSGKENYTSHSFRIGAASHAASQGVSDAQIQLMGRWNSNAFKNILGFPC